MLCYSPSSVDPNNLIHVKLFSLVVTWHRSLVLLRWASIVGSITSPVVEPVAVVHRRWGSAAPIGASHSLAGTSRATRSAWATVNAGPCWSTGASVASVAPVATATAAEVVSVIVAASKVVVAG